MLARRTFLSGSVLLLLMLAIATPASSQIIDQEQTDTSTPLASMTLGPLLQSFIPDASEIIGAGFYRTGTTSGDLTVGLYDDLPRLGGALLASGVSVNTSGQGYVDVFWDSLSITPGATYYLQVTGDNYDGSTGNLILDGSGPTNPYADGQMWFTGGTNTLPDYDYAFRTFSVVPEPSAALLLGLGLGTLSRLRRRG